MKLKQEKRYRVIDRWGKPEGSCVMHKEIDRAKQAVKVCQKWTPHRLFFIEEVTVYVEDKEEK